MLCSECNGTGYCQLCEGKGYVAEHGGPGKTEDPPIPSVPVEYKITHALALPPFVDIQQLRPH